jgi:hypothetical protein
MKFGIIFILTFGCLFAEIQELTSFSSLEKHLTDDTLLLLDIDDTLLVPVQMLGCDEWFCHRLKEKSKSCDSRSALEKTLAEWEGVRHLTSMEVVEPGTQTILTILQDKGVMMMGLTTQGLALATRTHQQLQQNGLIIQKTTPMKNDCYLLIDSHGVLYRNGILFTSGMPKGKSLFALFDEMDFHPTRIVFVNDKKSHLQDVEEEAEEQGVEFLGLRYSYSDQKKARFSPDVAEHQYSHSNFGKILSDQEAMEQLRNKEGELAASSCAKK